MSSTQKFPFVGGVHANQNPADVLPLNGKNFSEDAIRDTGLTPEELEEVEYEKQLQEIEQKRLASQKRKQDALDEAYRLKLVDINKAREAAVNFRKEARTCTNEDEKKSLYEWAREADAEARKLEVEAGLTVEADVDGGMEPVEKKSFFERNRWVMAILQVFGVIFAIKFLNWRFEDIGHQIMAINKGLPPEQQEQPFGNTSIQKVFFEKMVLFTDLPTALVVLFLVVPFVGFYVLPFLKSRKDFYTEFFEDLTAWQRAIITTAFCLGLLFFLALSHIVKA